MVVSKNWKKWSLYLALIIAGFILNELFWFTKEVGFSNLFSLYQPLLTGLITGLFIIRGGKYVYDAAELQRQTLIEKHNEDLKKEKHKAATIMLGKAINRQKIVKVFLQKDYILYWLAGRQKGEAVIKLPEAMSYGNHDISILSGNVIAGILDCNDRIKIIKSRLAGNEDGLIKKWDTPTSNPNITLGEWLDNPIYTLNDQLLYLIHELDKYTESELPQSLIDQIEEAILNIKPKQSYP